jgi:hypothetical protein
VKESLHSAGELSGTTLDVLFRAEQKASCKFATVCVHTREAMGTASHRFTTFISVRVLQATQYKTSPNNKFSLPNLTHELLVSYPCLCHF